MIENLREMIENLRKMIGNLREMIENLRKNLPKWDYSGRHLGPLQDLCGKKNATTDIALKPPPLLRPPGEKYV